MLPSPEKFDPIYAAFAGAAIAMFGSFITAWFTGRQATKRQKNDLQHSSLEKQKERDHIATQKELERLHILRRECYLPFMDAMASAVGFVPTIPTCPIDAIRTLVPIIELGRHISRVTLIAPPSIIEPMINGSLLLQTIATDLINKRWAIEEVSSELDLNRSSVQRMIDRQRNLNARIDNMIDSGEPKPQIQLLYQEHEELGKRIQDLIRKQGPLSDKKTDLELGLQQEAAHLLQPIKEHSIPIITAIRSEIGLPLDEDWYRRFSEKSGQKAFQVISKFQNDLRNRIKPNEV
ncbi:MAG: hypothetical protein OJI67_20260 [Prosthecobacter sp.]|nr:hypothetical protein [Prosthecobacter sp.]